MNYLYSELIPVNKYIVLSDGIDRIAMIGVGTGRKRTRAILKEALQIIKTLV